MKIKSLKGSNTLAGLIASVSGVLFAMLMGDVSRYVIARSAVQQAAEQVSRCLTPTDPACVQLNATPSDQQYDWYGIKRGQETSRSADRYNYNGTVRRQQWELTLPGYEIHKIPLPPLETNILSVPIVQFSPELNRYERRFASLQATFDEIITNQVRRYAPLVEPGFPEFHPTYEQQRRYQLPSSWAPIAFNQPGIISSGFYPAAFTEQPEVSFPQTRIPSGSSSTFESQDFEVPELEVGPGIVCLDSGGNICDLSYASGGGASDMWQYAHVAIKGFAEVRKVGSGTLQVRWAGSPWNEPGTPDGYGLSLVRYSKNRYQQYKAELQAWLANPVGPRPELTAADEVVECLGGTAWDDISQNSWAHHHLVLRGSIERFLNGQIDYGVGRNSACPGGDNIHWDLKVERGGAYRIRGFMKARHAGGADVKVSYRHFIDGYAGSFVTMTTTSEGTGNCSGELPLDRNAPVANCAALAGTMCSLAPENQIRSCNQSIRKEPDCATPEAAANNNFLFELFPATCGASISAAVCDPDWKPISNPSCTNLTVDYPGRSLCGWGAIPSSQSVSIGATFSCPAATASMLQLSCGDGRGEVTYRADGNYGTVADCPGALAQLALQQQVVNQVNSSQPPNSVIFTVPSLDSFSWGVATEFEPPRWVRSINPVDEFGNTITDPLSVRTATLNWQSVGDIYKRTDSSWTPPLSSFALSGAELAAVSTGAASLSLISEEDLQIQTGYPFANRPEFEIPGFIPSPQSLETCTGDVVPLEERLKHYADRQISGIASNAVWFNSSASYVDTANASSVSTCNGAQNSVPVPPCTVLSDPHTRSLTCGSDTYLGRFDSANSPLLCQNGTYDECRSEFVSGTEGTYEQNVDINLAKAAGMRELQRAYPRTLLGCDTVDCSNVDVDLSADDRAKVTVSYNLPLSFPFSEIVGTNSMNISAEKEDIRELSLVGWRASIQP